MHELAINIAIKVIPAGIPFLVSVTQVNSKNLVQRYLPKQTDAHKILKIIQRKVSKRTHLPVTEKEIQV